MVAPRELFQELDIERLHEAHVRDRRIERLGGFERRLQHRAERKDRDPFALPADLALADRDGRQLLADLTDRGAARIAHRRRAVQLQTGGEHLAALFGIRRRH